MAEDHRSRGLPPREHPEDSQYPPPPGEEDDRQRSYHLPPPMASGVTLPSIQDAAQGPYGAPQVSRAYPPPDPRTRGAYSASPTNSNGYAPPPAGGAYLPPLQDHYYGPQRVPYGGDAYAAYPGYRPPPGGPYPYPPEYPRVGASAPQPAQQAAPRQRTSIACRYCRKRKIRCSGYQNTTNGKCTNCDKLRIECVFQPVSSNSSAAFIPVSAVPGGVPPGTPLYGAYGQPLPPAGSVVPQPTPYPPPPPINDYHFPMVSPTGSFPPHPDDRSDHGRRRPRPQEDDHGMRLPPPVSYQDEDPRRRSPASNQSGNTPPASYHQYQQGSGYDPNRTPTPQRNSPGGPAPPPTTTSSASSIMSLGNLMDHPPPPRQSDTTRDIDQSMLGRLNRRT